MDKFLPAEDYFRRGLYMFDIGQNDLAGAFYSKSEDQVVASIPTILLEFEQRIKVSWFSPWIMSLALLKRSLNQLEWLKKKKKEVFQSYSPKTTEAKMIKWELQRMYSIFFSFEYWL